MKCIKNLSDNTVKRVSNEAAGLAVESGKFSFASKCDWKKETRKITPASALAPEAVVSAEDHATKVAKQARKAETRARSKAKKDGNKVKA